MKYDDVSSSGVLYSVLPIEFFFLMAALFQLLLFLPYGWMILSMDKIRLKSHDHCEVYFFPSTDDNIKSFS